MIQNTFYSVEIFHKVSSICFIALKTDVSNHFVKKTSICNARKHIEDYILWNFLLSKKCLESSILFIFRLISSEIFFQKNTFFENFLKLQNFVESGFTWKLSSRPSSRTRRTKDMNFDPVNFDPARAALWGIQPLFSRLPGLMEKYVMGWRNSLNLISSVRNEWQFLEVSRRTLNLDSDRPETESRY